MSLRVGCRWNTFSACRLRTNPHRGSNFEEKLKSADDVSFLTRWLRTHQFVALQDLYQNKSEQKRILCECVHHVTYVWTHIYYITVLHAYGSEAADRQLYENMKRIWMRGRVLQGWQAGTRREAFLSRVLVRLQCDRKSSIKRTEENVFFLCTDVFCVLKIAVITNLWRLFWFVWLFSASKKKVNRN